MTIQDGLVQESRQSGNSFHRPAGGLSLLLFIALTSKKPGMLFKDLFLIYIIFIYIPGRRELSVLVVGGKVQLFSPHQIGELSHSILAALAVTRGHAIVA